MFERYTDRARKTVAEAQDAARDLNHNYIGTEHLLLGIVREGGGTGWQVLNQWMSEGDIWGALERGSVRPEGHIPFTPRVKKVLEVALREALQLGCNYVGQEHLLLGLVREGEGAACRILRDRLNTDDLSVVRTAVLNLLRGYEPPERPEAVEPLPDWDDLLGRRVRVWDGPQSSVRAEGELIGVIVAPCLVIRRDDGTRAYESSDLPIDWRRDEWRKAR